MKSIKVELV